MTITDFWTKFGTEHKYHTVNTPEWPNSHELKIQDGGGRHLEYRENVNNFKLDKYVLHWLEKTLAKYNMVARLRWAGAHNNSSYDGTDWDDSWVVASKQHLCCKTVSLVLVVTANSTVNVLLLWGVEIKNIHNFDENWMTVPLWYKKIKSGRKTANINTKSLRSSITVKAHCSMTHLKQQKSLGFFLVLHWAMDVIYDIPGPMEY